MQVRAFLGLAGYCRWFISTFSELTSPMTNLNRKAASDLVQWAEPCQRDSERVKKLKSHTPNFKLPSVLQTNKWIRGLGLSANSLSGRGGRAR